MNIDEALPFTVIEVVNAGLYKKTKPLNILGIIGMDGLFIIIKFVQ